MEHVHAKDRFPVLRFLRRWSQAMLLCPIQRYGNQAVAAVFGDAHPVLVRFWRTLDEAEVILVDRECLAGVVLEGHAICPSEPMLLIVANTNRIPSDTNL